MHRRPLETGWDDLAPDDRPSAWDERDEDPPTEDEQSAIDAGVDEIPPARRPRRALPHGYTRIQPRRTGASRKDGTRYVMYGVTIPVRIAEAVGTDRVFRVVLTDDGILLRPETPPVKSDPAFPAWIEEGS